MLSGDLSVHFRRRGQCRSRSHCHSRYRCGHARCFLPRRRRSHFHYLDHCPVHWDQDLEHWGPQERLEPHEQLAFLAQLQI